MDPNSSHQPMQEYPPPALEGPPTSDPISSAGQPQPYFPPPPTQEGTVTNSALEHPPPPPYHPGEHPPPLPEKVPASTGTSLAQADGPYEQTPQPGFQTDQALALSGGEYKPPPPPRRRVPDFGDDDPSSPVHYTRDPHKLVAYLVPFPKPLVKGVESAGIPDRFLIYTPPPPPLHAPAEGVKEDKLHKVQRKWQEEVRSAKTSDAKTASWKGVKGKATKGINYVMTNITSSNLDFVNRIPGGRSKSPGPDKHQDDGVTEGDQTHKTVGLEEMILIYPTTFQATPDQVRLEFVNTMMRTKSKAQKDAVLATGLLPVSAAIDLLATVVWPFGGLLEVDGVWAYSSIRGAKTARSVTKRLTSSMTTQQHDTEDQEMQGEKLHLDFRQSPRLEVLDRYLAAKCAERSPGTFPRAGPTPTETEVLNAIGWAPAQNKGGDGRNWEDEQWETEEVKEDMRSTLGKAAKEWDKWCTAFIKNPEKALKK